MKKILLKSLFGFTLGVTLLVMAYVSIYFVSGEDVFIVEIQQLQNIKTLITQVLISGMAYFIIIALLNASSYVSETYHKTNPYKVISITILVFVIMLLVMFFLLGNTNIYSENISSVNVIIIVLVYASYGIIFGIITFFQKNLIHKINQKLKEKSK